MKTRWLVLGVLVVAVAAGGGCAGLQYYGQAISGHLDIMQRSVRIEDRLADPATPPELRSKLEQVLAIREFASRELRLPDNGSYRSYADVGRPYIVWNVFAAPEFSVAAKESCFAIVGCVGYRGYYDQGNAERYLKSLRAEGWDVFVYGVPAYSTLGWFDDPVLNTFVRYPGPELARLVFHELAHQVAYVSGDTTFNESFAVAVEEVGVKRWMAQNATPKEQEAYVAARQYRADFVQLVLRYRDIADALYREPGSIAAKRAAKRALFADMQRDYEALKLSWGGFAGYDRFFAGGVGNAHLASVATYEQLVPAFRALLARKGEDLSKFYAAVKSLIRLDKTARDRQLAALTSAAEQRTSLR